MHTSNLKYRYMLIFVLILVFSCCILVFQKKAPFKEGGVSEIFSSIFNPAGSLLTWSGKGTNDFLCSFFNSSGLKQENESLILQNQKLMCELQNAKVYKEENITLRQLLDLKREFNGNGIAAEVIFRDPTNWFENFVVNRGTVNGITRKMVVIAPSGVVGRVNTLNSTSTSVCTIINPKSAVPVYIVESGSYGILYGEGSALCTLEFIRNSSFLQEGNLVVTSGIGDIYPPGLIVGKTVNVQRSADGLSYLAKVKPFINFDSLTEVLFLRGKID